MARAWTPAADRRPIYGWATFLGALVCVFAAARAPASTGGLIEVVQPMVGGDSDNIVLRTVTFEVDALYVGQQIDYTCTASATKTASGCDNHNIANVCGVSAHVVWPLGRPVPTRTSDGATFVDSLIVEIDMKTARARLQSGVEFGGIRFGPDYFDALLSATQTAISENAARSWPQIGKLRIRILGLGAKPRESVVYVQTPPK